LALTALMACLHLDRPNGAVLSVARDLAQRFDASVVGVAARQADMHLSARAVGPAEPHGHELGKFRACADAAEREFRETLEATSNLAWRAQLTFGPASDFVAREARTADLVLVSTERGDHFVFPSGCAEPGDLLMRLGRPILAVPARVAGFNPGSALVCWKDTREARRAISDAMPLLRVMQRVDVVEIAEPRALEDTRASLAELSEWLRGHGVESNCTAEAPRGTEAEQLGTIARERRVDLIVAGAFGHSRLREWAFGGVTRDLVLSADCCVLASH
jgi:nucleotide-binding universal stress UspA family protein